MGLKQAAILISGITGIVLVAVCPRWVYPSHPLISPKRIIGYRFITNAPEPLPVFKMKNGLRVINANNTEVVSARIDREDLSARIALIIALTACGLWLLRRLPSIENRKRHWILILLATFGLLLAAHIQTAGNTN